MTHKNNLFLSIFITWFIFVGVMALSAFSGAAMDYVGKDNDDVMRLVQVRDWMSGQGWFDLYQYRLGLEGGTLMHWSRLVDLPIAMLISFFALFFSPLTAEAIALSIWPPLTALGVIYAFAKIGQIFDEKSGAIFGAIGAVGYLMGAGKFKPGAIDHHNLQLVALALMIAILIKPNPNWKAYIVAGLIAALAIAIGAETLPVLAVICGVIAVTWAWHGGKIWRRPTRVFALSLGLSLTIIFFATTPPDLYHSVTCDALSFGYYSLSVAGSALLFLSAALASYKSRAIRFLCLGATGILVFLLALIVAPQCLQSPLADLDPMLIKYWLNNVIEAKSILALFAKSPTDLLGFYTVPVLALCLCAYLISSKVRVELHLKIFVLLLIAFLISLVQVRGAVFANLIAIMPMIGCVIAARKRANENPKDSKAALVFVASVLISFPIFWAILGESIQKLTNEQPQVDSDGKNQISCKTQEQLSDLQQQEMGVVLAPSNLGASILRFTNHRVLAAPYHRNQAGILAEIKAALASPEDAYQIMKDASVDYILFCKSDPQVKIGTNAAPNGLYAQLKDGKVPDYLEDISSTENSTIQLYRLK